MIRQYGFRDETSISTMLKKELKNFNENKLIQDLSSDTTIKYVFSDNNDIKGFIILFPQDDFCEVSIYVKENARRSGIGSSLLKQGLSILSDINIKNIRTEIRTETYDTGSFFIKNGFKFHFGYKNMTYSGSSLTSKIELQLYDSSMYDSYKNVYHECFYDMRHALDLKPYHCCSSPDDLEKNKNNIYILKSHDEVIASVVINRNEIDDLIVSKSHQNKGLGKELVRFAVSKIRLKNSEDITLGVATWNEKAVHIYENLGFKTCISGDFYYINFQNKI